MSTDQDDVMRQLLTDLQLLGYGTTASLNPSAGGDAGDHQGGRRPPGEAHPEYERLLREYNAAWTDRGRARVIQAARDELKRWRGLGPRPPVGGGETLDQLKARIAAKVDGTWSTKELAFYFRCSPRLVIAVEREVTMRRLAEAGNTQRQIGSRFGVAHTTVGRILKSRRRAAGSTSDREAA